MRRRHFLGERRGVLTGDAAAVIGPVQQAGPGLRGKPRNVARVLSKRVTAGPSCPAMTGFQRPRNPATPCASSNSTAGTTTAVYRVTTAESVRREEATESCSERHPDAA